MELVARWAKRIATILLIASFCLPLTRCSISSRQFVNSDGSTVLKEDGTPVVEKEHFDVHGYDLVSLRDWPIWFLAFFWPLLIQLAALFPRFNSKSRVIATLEVVLILMSSFLIGYLIYHSDGLRYGSFTTFAALLLYALGVFTNLNAATPNNSFKPSPLRGLGAGSHD